MILAGVSEVAMFIMLGRLQWLNFINPQMTDRYFRWAYAKDIGFMFFALILGLGFYMLSLKVKNSK